MFDNYAEYTNVDWNNTGAIDIVGLGDDDYMLLDCALDHRAALRIAESRCGDFYQVRLCYPGQTIVLKNEAWWDADDEAEQAAAAYLAERRYEEAMREIMLAGADFISAELDRMAPQVSGEAA